MPGIQATTPPLKFPLPDHYTIVAGADTGTYCSAVIGAAFQTEDDLPGILLLEEFPNYRYVSGEPELLDMSVSEWCKWFRQAWRRYCPDKRARAWADMNTQFRSEYRQHRVELVGNPVTLDVRVERTREYLMAKTQCVWFAPWLSVLPFEMERARWPSDESAGRIVRVKGRDHTLDSVEHICSRKPRGRAIAKAARQTFLEQMYIQHRRYDLAPRHDRHLGRN